MILMDINDLAPRMIVGRVVRSKDGTTLLEKGAYLTKSRIDKLFSWGISSLYITDGIEDQTQFIDQYKDIVKAIKKIFEDIGQSKKIPIGEIRELVDKSISPLLHMAGVLDYLYEIRSHSDYTFQHSVHVAVITGIFASWLHYDDAQCKELIMAGLLHDIGKLHVPLKILDKPGKLLDSEFIAIKKHPAEGYGFLKNSNEISEDIKMAVWQHHESVDGSGYPFGLNGSEIHEYATLVAIADLYDAMTSDRAYRRKLIPFVAMETIAEQMHHKFNASVCIPILDNMRDYFIGSDVLLSNGQKAIVIIINPESWTQPMIRTYDGTFLDLRRENISVVDLISKNQGTVSLD